MARILFLFASLFLISCAQTTSELDSDDSSIGQLLTREDYNSGQIFLLRGQPKRYQEYLEFFPDEYVIDALEKLRKRSKNYITSDESMHTVIFVYGNDIVSKSVAVTKHQFQRGTKLYNPFKMRQIIPDRKGSNGPLVILNETHAGGSGGYLHYSLTLEGKEVVRKKVTIR